MHTHNKPFAMSWPRSVNDKYTWLFSYGVFLLFIGRKSDFMVEGWKMASCNDEICINKC